MKNIKRTLIVSALALIGAVGVVAADGPPKVIEIKALANIYKVSTFDHEAHTGVADSCRSCHHKPFGKPMACTECHEEPMEKKDFKHEAHWEYDSCASCHQVKSTRELACSSCHKIPFDEKRIEVIGLKGAIHAQCMDCHQENGVDNSCTTCHARK